MNWIKVGKEFRKDAWGQMPVVIYQLEGHPYKIESRRVKIEHANGVGYWEKTDYYLIMPDGSERMFWKLQNAKDAVEEILRKEQIKKQKEGMI